MGRTLYKAEEPVKAMGLLEKEEEKDQKHKEKLIRKNLMINRAY